ncbi:MAG TPA: error-prone DNA polymerase [Polyangiaceae bacterium]|nr:error-prone DNA polymerase [Polyangiaceae bacterium]
MAFAELLATSAFSFLRGASRPEEMVGRAHELGISSLALCDRDGLYGSVRAWTEARTKKMPYHVGVELSLSPNGEPVERTDSPRSYSATERQLFARNEPPTCCLLVQNAQGYENLCRLLTRAHAGLPKGHARLEPEMLSQPLDGLICIIPAEITTAAGLQHWLGPLGECFAERGWIGVFRRWDGFDDLRIQCADTWRRLTGFRFVASARPLMHEAKRKPLVDIVQCIRQGLTLDEAGQALTTNAQAFLRSEEQLLRAFRHNPEWVHESAEIARELQFDLSQVRYQFPCATDSGQTPDQRLERLTWEGAHSRYPDGVTGTVEQQLRKELALIGRLNVAAYFLCTWEIIQIAKELRILCQGRGSAANSAVCYALGITAVDPERSNLLFERFLSEERAEPPDIDIDFEHERREEVIQEIYRRYGREHAAMVSEVICYRGKSALREVGKVLGFSLEQIDRLSASITHWDNAEACRQRLTEYGFDPADRRVRYALEWARELEGFPRHLSIHVGGFVLSKTPLFSVAPVEPASMVDRTVVPWDKDDIEALGFFKVDVLGLGMLTAIRKTLDSCFEDGVLRRDPNEKFNALDVVSRIPSEDKAVYARISEADTVGVFQIESRAQMAMLPRLRPQYFYDLVIEVALVRPGPIQGGMVHPYLRRRNGEEAAAMPHPMLTAVLKRTLGVPLFQEQVMQLAIVGAGYSGGEADQLRRDMAAWKKSGKLLRHRERLLSGFAANGISREFGEALFEQIKGFGEYGFPESHAASFALLVYISAWQKTHFPAQFCAALINSQPMGFYSPASLIRDAQKHGVHVRPVRVNTSQWDCSIEPDVESKISSSHPEAKRAVRLGFRLVRGLREQSVERLVAAREKAAFSSVHDFRKRVPLNKDQFAALSEAGAFEDLEPERRQAIWASKAPDAPGLFASIAIEEERVELPPLQRSEQLLLDYSRVGISLHDHPMLHWRKRLRARNVLTTNALEHVAHKSEVSVAGLVLARQRPATASGVVFITLEDEMGSANLVVFSQVYERFHHVAKHARLLLARGKLERQVTQPRPGEVGRATAVIHVIVESLIRLDNVDSPLRAASRDFH